MMSLSNSSFRQKAFANSLDSAEIGSSLQENSEIEPQSLQAHTIQLSAEQAIELGIKFYDSESENIAAVPVSPTSEQVFNLTQTLPQTFNFSGRNEDTNLQRLLQNPNPSALSFLIKPVGNNASLLNKNLQVNENTTVSAEDVNELLSFGNDEEGTVYLQNNTFEKSDNTQLHYKRLFNKGNQQKAIIESNYISKQPRNINPKSMNTIKPYKLVAPQNRPNKINYCNQTLTLPNSQKVSLQSLLNKKPAETYSSILNTNSRRPVSVVPIKKQNRVKSILFKPNVPVSNNSILASNSQQLSVLQTQAQSANMVVRTLNNNGLYSVVNQTDLLNASNINVNNSSSLIRNFTKQSSIQNLNGKLVPGTAVDQSLYKLDYTLDLVDNNTPASNSGQNLTYTINLVNESDRQNPDTQSNTHEENNITNNVSEKSVDNVLLNKTVTSEVSKSIVPLTNAAKPVTVSEPETNAVQEALQRYPVNTDKPLGSTDNPIKLVQKGQIFHSLQSLNENQLQQIAGALKHRPPYQQSGDREPHKVVLYDSATHTRIIYRIVYPDELNLKPGPDAEIDTDNKNTKERRKRKMKSKAMPTVTPQENKQALPRTRTGRVIRPPNRIMQDYKRLRPNDDSDREEWIDTTEEERLSGQDDPNYNIPSAPEPSNENRSTTETLKEDTGIMYELPRKSRQFKSKFRCPTCNKIYLGYGKMSKHLALYPDHGELDKLGIEPPCPKPKIKKKYWQRGRTKNVEVKSIDTMNISDNSNDDSNHQKSLFEFLMQKMERTPVETKWDTMCKEVTGFLQQLQKFVKNQVISEDKSADAEHQIRIDESMSQILDLKSGQYSLQESFFSKPSDLMNNTESTITSVSKSCPSSPVSNILDNSFGPIEQIQPLENNEDHVDIDMLCSTNSEYAKNVLSNPQSDLQRQMDILINNDVCHNMSSEAHNVIQNQSTLENMNSSSIVRNDMPLNSEDGMVFQNVDELVHESLKNLTADEIAAVPPLEHSSDDLVNSQSSLPDLTLDLFQFHHN